METSSPAEERSTVPSGKSGVGFTPGPWRIETRRPEICVNAKAEFMPVGSCGCCDGVWINGDSRAQQQANALLIAAAPELYEALALAENVLSRQPFSGEIWPDGTHPNTGIEKIRAALKKARGEL